MPSCRFEILVSAYLDGELNAEERDLFEKHLAGCEMCRTLVAEWQEVERALRGERLKQALHDEGRLADSVRRDLSQSGAFRRARRRSFLRRATEHVAMRWPTYAVGLGVVLAAAAAVWGLAAARQSSSPPQSAGGAPKVSAPRRASLPELLAEAEGVLQTLVRDAGSVPGAGRRIRDDLIRNGLPTHLAYETSRIIRDGDLDRRLAGVQTVLVLLANLPDDRADAEAALVAQAVETSELLDDVERLKQRLMAEAY